MDRELLKKSLLLSHLERAAGALAEAFLLLNDTRDIEVTTEVAKCHLYVNCLLEKIERYPEKTKSSNTVKTTTKML